MWQDGYSPAAAADDDQVVYSIYGTPKASGGIATLAGKSKINFGGSLGWQSASFRWTVVRASCRMRTGCKEPSFVYR